MKKSKLVITTVLVSSLLTMVSYAGQWKADEKGYWWQDDDGSYPVNTWRWIDGNQDGVSECYYFDGNGYMLSDTTTPDGNQVNESGAWVENGEIVQLQNSQTKVSVEEIEEKYYDYLGTLEKSESVRFDFVYLNDDEIPELMYTVGDSHAHGVYICTYDNGVVYPLTSYARGSYGYLTYFPRTGMILSADLHMGYETEIINIMQGLTMQELVYMSYNSGADIYGGTTSEYDEFRLNGEQSTKTEVSNYEKQLIGQLESAEFSYENAFEYHGERH
ncbi:hypothetical protein [Brotaphodocola sp.]|uniref:hypothetical protein n=1 Tax=Brotaphodocola sp. TaxID=3073577 RepID=UPI003D7D366E